MKYILYITIVIVLSAGQYFLSSRKSAVLGGVIPLLVIPFTVWVIKIRSLPINFDTLFPFIGLLIVLCSIWAEAREHLKKKQKRELEKIKAKDISE